MNTFDQVLDSNSLIDIVIDRERNGVNYQSPNQQILMFIEILSKNFINIAPPKLIKIHENESRSYIFENKKGHHYKIVTTTLAGRMPVTISNNEGDVTLMFNDEGGQGGLHTVSGPVWNVIKLLDIATKEWSHAEFVPTNAELV